MCRTENQQIIDTVVREFLDQGRAFTAFEVSLEARQRGATDRHRDMKGYIHQCPFLTNEMEFGDYTRTMVHVGDMGGRPLEAFLYHKNDYDPATYKPLNRKDSGPPPQVKQVAPPPAPVDDDDDDDKHMLDYRNRLLVPSKLVSGIAKAGELVHLYADTDGVGKCLFISRDKPDGMNTHTKMVEQHGVRIYVWQTMLRDAGLLGNKFNIESVQHRNQKAIKISDA